MEIAKWISENREFAYVQDRRGEVEKVADVGWPDPVTIQLALEPPPRTECPGHRFIIPAGRVELCAVCGESPNADEWRELMKMLKCHDARGRSSYMAHLPIVFDRSHDATKEALLLHRRL